MDFAERFVHETASEQRVPVIDAGKEREDASHGHDEMEVSDDEEGVVQIGVERGLGEDGAGESASNEEGDESQREKHGRGEA